MQRYANLSGHSGVLAYEAGPDFIDVRFVDGTTYRYTEAAIGRAHIREMKRLAQAGHGLSTYISRHPEVRDGWESKTTRE